MARTSPLLTHLAAHIAEKPEIALVPLSDPGLAILAHEFRQPLSVLTAVIEVLLRKVGADDNLELAGIARRQILQLTRLLDDCAGQESRLIGADLGVPHRPLRIDARDLLRGAVLDAASAARGGGQLLALDAGSKAIWIDGDRQRLQQLLSNLINNAIQYSTPGGQISLTLAQAAGGVTTISVADTGRGLAPLEIPHLFDLYWRGDGDEGDGLGIGLSVVRDIVESHHGQIEATSLGLGQGSQFIITLPAGALR